MKRTHLTIVVSSPDEDGDYRVEVMGGLPHENNTEQGEYSQNLAEILPDARELIRLLDAQKEN